MTKQLAPVATTYQQVIDLQDYLVRRGFLARRVHEVAPDSYRTVRDTVCLHCTCGEWLQYAAAGSSRAYTLEHVKPALRHDVAVAA